MLNTKLSYSGVGGVINDYKYSGKELTQGLNLYTEDFGWRHYDPALGRWNVQDPAGQFASPYLAMACNPTNFIDPDGAQTFPHYVQPKGDVTDGSVNKRNFFGGGGGWNYMSRYEQQQYQEAHGATYEQQEDEKIYTLASLGGYEAQDGSIYFFDNNAQLTPPSYPDASPIETIKQYQPASGSNSSGSNDVDLSTGAMQASIPLVSLSGRHLSTGVSLVYTGGQGIRVNETANNVGLGFSLSAGGYLKRTVRGIKDEKKSWESVRTLDPITNVYLPWSDYREFDSDEQYQSGWFDHHYFIETHTDSYYPYAIHYDTLYFSFFSMGNLLEEFKNISHTQLLSDHQFANYQWQYFWMVNNGILDSEPDLFSFSFDGYSGTFVFDKDGFPVLTPRQDIKIKPAFGPQNESTNNWIFTTPDGTQYIFENTDDFRESTKITSLTGLEDETYTDFNESQSVSQYISTWYLSAVQSTSGENINFDYTSGVSIEKTIISHARQDKITSDATSTGLYYLDADSFSNGVRLIETSSVEQTINPKSLSEISNSFGHIDFINSATVREDLPYQYPLEYLRLYNNNNVLQKEFQFTYDYYIAYAPSNNYQYKRMYLAGLQQNPVGISGTSIPTPDPLIYGFEYNTNYNLPDFNSTAQDYWGFYNGESSNDNLIPELTIYNPITESAEAFSGANREPNEDFTKANILTKITFPQGGSKAFEYEINKYYDPSANANKITGGLRVKRVIISDEVNTANDIITEYKYEQETDPSRSSCEVMPMRRLYDIQNSGDFYDDGSQYYANTVALGQTYYLRTLYCLRTSYPVRQGPSDFVRYTRVIKEQNGNGKTVYELTGFTSNPDRPVQKEKYLANFMLGGGSTNADCWIGSYDEDMDNAAGAWGIDMSSERGLITKISIYNETGNKINETLNEYDFIDNFRTLNQDYIPANILALKVKPDNYFFNRNIPGLIFPYSFNNGGRMNLEYYKISSIWMYLKKTTSIMYDPTESTEPITSVKEMEYDQLVHHQLKKVKTTNSDGKEHCIYYNYPEDYNPTGNYSSGTDCYALKRMKELHIINQPVEIYSTFKNADGEFVTSGSVLTYKNIANGDIKPYRVFSLVTPEPVELSAFVQSYINNNFSFITDNRYVLEKTKESYNNKSDLLVETDKNNISASRVWKEYSLAPVATFNNAKYADGTIGNECGYEGFEQTPVAFSAFSSIVSGGYSGYRCNRVSNNPNASSGNYSYSEVMEFLPNHQDQKYKLSAYVKTGAGFTANNGALVIEANDPASSTNLSYSEKRFDYSPGWQYVEVSMDLSSVAVAKLKCYAVNYDNSHPFDIDEIRFQPVNSVATSVCIDPASGQVVNSCDLNSVKSAYNEYDGFGRLVWAFDKDDNVLAYKEYHLKTGSNDQSYSRTYLFRAPLSKSGVVTKLANNSFDPAEANIVTNFTDGLGRNIETVGKGLSPGNNDMVNFTKYDASGRVPKSYLPYTDINSGNGSFKADPETDQLDYYDGTWNPTGVAQDAYPFAERVFESSPLNRVVEQGAPGQTWQPAGNHTQKISYRSNSTNEVMMWTCTNDGAEYSAYYEAGELFKNISTDENGRVTMSFTDKKGKLICTRSEVLAGFDADDNPVTYDFTNGTGAIVNPTGLQTVLYTTYYVYNNFNKLMFVIPPAATHYIEINGLPSFIEDDDIFKDFIFCNKYDEKGRAYKKKTPGSAWQSIVYNKQDNPVLVQTGNQAMDNEWTFMKYDIFGRAVSAGKYFTEAGPQDLQAEADDPATVIWEQHTDNSSAAGDDYTNDAFPVIDVNAADEYYVINFFDDYSFDTKGKTFSASAANPTAKESQLQGLATGRKVRILESDPPVFLTTINYYDNKYRPVQKHTEHQLEGWDRTDVEYSFTSGPEKTIRNHTSGNGSVNLQITNRYEYDHAGRLLNSYQQTGGDPEVKISDYRYNESGQVIQKNLHEDANADYLQKIDFRYNIRGWLEKINNASLEADGISNNDDDDAFGEEIMYDNQGIVNSSGQPAGLEQIALFNGNISAIKWKSKPPAAVGSSKPENAYVYRYDDQGKLTAAYYANNKGFTTFSHDMNFYNEKMSYDMAGNIQTLQRKSKGDIIDELSYTYINNSNKLSSVSDAAGYAVINDFHDIDVIGNNDYSYDANGNMVGDLNKDITTTYNYLNKPKNIINQANEQIDYTYDALGNKLSKTVNGYTISYVNGIEYNAGELAFIATEEGRVRPKRLQALNNTDYVYDYFLKDHIGNVRVVLTEERTLKQYIATMEDDNDAAEREVFLNIPETRADKPSAAPYDSTCSPDQRVSGLDENMPIGHAKVLKMNEGDIADINVRYYYEFNENFEDNPGINPQMILSQLGNIFFINNPYNPVPGDAAMNAAAAFTGNGEVNELLSSVLWVPDSPAEAGIPKAYLIYLYFNENFEFRPNVSGVLRATNADELGDLAVTDIEAPENGYLYVYVSNESREFVSFDNLQILHHPGAVLEINDYYPYGMLNTKLSYSGVGGVINDYKYSGKELTQGLNLYTEDFGWRHYDPALGRWNVQDPAGQFASPYLAMACNPTNFIDPDGAKTFPHYVQPKGDVTDGSINKRNFFGGGGGWNYMSRYEQQQFTNDHNAAQIIYTDENGQMQITTGHTEEGSDGTIYVVDNNNGQYVYSSNITDHPVYNGQLITSASVTVNGVMVGPGSQNWNYKGSGGSVIVEEANFPSEFYYERTFDDVNTVNTDKIAKMLGAVGVNMDMKEGMFEMAKKSGDIGKAGENYLKLTKWIGKATGYANAATAWYDYSKNPTTGAFIKAIGHSGLALVRINPFVGVGLGILDLSGGTDWFYNQAGDYWDKNWGGQGR